MYKTYWWWDGQWEISSNLGNVMNNITKTERNSKEKKNSLRLQKVDANESHDFPYSERTRHKWRGKNHNLCYSKSLLSDGYATELLELLISNQDLLVWISPWLICHWCYLPGKSITAWSTFVKCLKTGYFKLSGWNCVDETVWERSVVMLARAYRSSWPRIWVRWTCSNRWSR